MEKITMISILLVVALLFSSAASATQFTPASIEATLNPGESVDETKTVITDAVPIGTVDIVFSFDLTGSMGGILGTAKSNAISIMDSVDTEVPNAQYGVISYMDYPAYYKSFGYAATYGSASSGDYPYSMDQAITNDKTAVSTAINGLSLGFGNDGPESYTRALYESYADTSLNYRPGAKKILVNFGDNLPHDNNINEGVPGKTGIYSTGGDPGRNGIMDETSDPSKIGVGNDDLDLQTVLQEMKANGVTLLHLHTTYLYLEYWEHWAGITGGAAFQTSTDATSVKNTIVSLVGEVVSNINEMTLSVDTGYEGWVTWTPETYTNVGGDETRLFDVTITVPAGASPGEYNFKIYLMADGATLATQDVKITVPGGTSDSGSGDSGSEIPEFPTIILPMAAILGLALVFMRRK